MDAERRRADFWHKIGVFGVPTPPKWPMSDFVRFFAFFRIFLRFFAIFFTFLSIFYDLIQWTSFMQSMNNHSSSLQSFYHFIAHSSTLQTLKHRVFSCFRGPRDRVQKWVLWEVWALKREIFRGLCNLWTHPRSLAITCTQHSLQQTSKKCESHRVGFWGPQGSQRQGPPKNGGAWGVWALKRSLEVCAQSMNTS